jgi:hypothetical protein
VPTEKPKAIALGFSVGTMLWGETSVQVAGNFFVFTLLGQLDADTEHREIRRGSLIRSRKASISSEAVRRRFHPNESLRSNS